MWFRKKPEAPPPSPSSPACNHKYRDFDWYFTANYYIDTKRFEVKVYEPYVCIFCGHRKDVLLDEESGYGLKDCSKAEEQMREKYPIKDRAYVEDKISDMQLLDPYYLDAYFKLYPEKKGS